MVTAVTGDIGSGKSTVSRLLGRCLDADVMAKELWNAPEVKAEAVCRWGREILGPDGGVILAKVAEVVFSSKREHDFCSSLLHPRVMEELRRRAGDYDVLEIPLLPEVGRPEWIGRVIYVAAEFEVRAERCRVRGWDREELLRRESFLLPREERMAVCDVVVRNDGDIAALLREVEGLRNVVHLFADFQAAALPSQLSRHPGQVTPP